MPSVIYALKDANGEVFYVGQTFSSALKIRVQQHKSASRAAVPGSPVARHIRAIGENFTALVLETSRYGFGSGDSGREAYWIRYFEDRAADLKNIQFSKVDTRRLCNRTPGSCPPSPAQPV